MSNGGGGLKTDHEIYEKRQKRMARIDALDPSLRALIHEYGATVVYGFMDCGVVKPKHIRHLVETVLDEFSPTRGSFSSQGIRSSALDRAEKTVRFESEGRAP